MLYTIFIFSCNTKDLCYRCLCLVVSFALRVWEWGRQRVVFCYHGSAQDLVHLSTTEVKLSEAMTFLPHQSHEWSYRVWWQGSSDYLLFWILNAQDGMRSCPIGFWSCYGDGFWFMMAWQWWVMESNYDEERQIWWRFWISWRTSLWPGIDRCQNEIFGLNLALRAASADAQWPNVPCREETLQIIKVIAVPCVTVRFLVLEKLPCMFKP